MLIVNTNTVVHVLTGPFCKLWEHRFSVPGLASIPTLELLFSAANYFAAGPHHLLLKTVWRIDLSMDEIFKTWGNSEIVGKLYATELQDNLIDVYFK